MLIQLCAVSLLSLSLALPGVAQVEDAAIDQAVKAFSSEQPEIYESASNQEEMINGFKNLADTTLAEIEIEELTASQIATLVNAQLGYYANPETRAGMLKRLESIALDEKTAQRDAALAAAVGSTLDVINWNYQDVEAPAWERETRSRLHAMYLGHPTANEVFATEHAANGISAMLMPTQDEEIVPSSRFRKLLNAIGPVPAGAGVVAVDVMWTIAQEMHERDTDPISDETRERTRLLAIKWYENGAKHFTDLNDEPRAGYYNRMAQTLNSRAARGMLIGYEAPELSIQWCSDETITSLDDLKGKVVILDFWATWCGPCIRTFPQVAKLREMYPEEHVAIIGVTSPQGAIYNMSAAEPAPIDCEGDVEKEIGLMPRFMESHEITWDIVMLNGEGSVAPPDYDVQGIPHVAILDAEGKIRYNALHPDEPGKPEKINALLKEAGLPVPEEG